MTKEVGKKFNEETTEILNQAAQLTSIAQEDAISRLPRETNRSVIERVKNGIRNRFFPYTAEALLIAHQIESEEYRKHVHNQQEFLGTKMGFIVCPDGRIVSVALIDPRVGSTHRRLQGMPEIRQSTLSGEPVLVDPDLATSITLAVREQNVSSNLPELVEFAGPHTDSIDPVHEGCGAGKAITTARGQAVENAMRYGAIPEYFEEIGDGLNAFNIAAKRAGGIGSTIDTTHDSYSQGLIFGLAKESPDFDPLLTLRQNLLHLHTQGRILMTELLDPVFTERIMMHADRRGIKNLNLHDPLRFKENMIAIGEISREITADEEMHDGFHFIPNSLKNGLTQKAVKALGYVAIRNSVYRILGRIEPGNHPLIRHPEKLIQVGAIGAAFNIAEIPFHQSTPAGMIRPQDIEGVKTLYGLSASILLSQGINLQREARIIVATGVYDPDIYINDDARFRGHTAIANTTRNNAATIRNVFSDGIVTGNTTVIAALFSPGSRAISEVLKSF